MTAQRGWVLESKPFLLTLTSLCLPGEVAVLGQTELLVVAAVLAVCAQVLVQLAVVVLMNSQ